MPLAISIVEDHRETRENLVALLEDAPELHVQSRTEATLKYLRHTPTA